MIDGCTDWMDADLGERITTECHFGVPQELQGTRFFRPVA